MTLRELVTASGKTQAEVAAAAALSPQYLSSLVKGRRSNPALSAVRGLATALQVSESVVLAALRGTPADPEPLRTSGSAPDSTAPDAGAGGAAGKGC